MSTTVLKAIEVHHHRVALRSQGYLLLKVNTASKTPAEPNWQQPTKSRSLQQWEADQTSDATLNTGIVTHGLRAMDIDIDDPSLAALVTTTCKQILGNAPCRGRENSGRCILLYRSNKAAPKAAKLTGALGAVEARGNGQMFVAHGIHESGVLYQWDSDLRAIPRDSLNEVSDEQIELFFEAIHRSIGAESPYNRIKQESPALAPVSIPTISRRENEYAIAALNCEVERLSAMQAGSGRNSALNVAAHSLGTMTVVGWIDARVVAHTLFDAAVANGYVAKRGEDAAKKTIMSGLNAGALKPRLPLPDESAQIDLSKMTISGRSIGVVLTELGITGRNAEASKAQAALAQMRERSVVLTGLAGVVETAIEWRWPGYLPAGMLTLLSGNGGTGKSTLAFAFAATITTGGLWPDGQRCAGSGNVLIWSSEDDIARTIKPRLMAAGADINRIAAIESTTDEAGMKLPFDPATDIESLRAEVRRVGGISLLIIDPIVSAVSGDMHKANDVRRSLQPIVDFAAESNCAVLGITHFAKNTIGRNTSERVIGSQAFAALARMVLVTAKEEDSDMRVFTRAKSNISLDDGGLHYTIEPVDVRSSSGATLHTTRVVWGGAIQGTARSILSSVENDEPEHYGKKMDEAKNFLYNALSNGPVPVTQVKTLARNARIASVTLQRAKEAMNIQSAKRKGEFVDGWDWSLPAQMMPPPENLLR